MARLTGMVVASVGGVGALLLALWGWHAAPSLVRDCSRPDVAAGAIRCAAVAMAACAQAVLIAGVAAPMYRNTRIHLLGWAAGVVGSVALVSAIALGIAGR